MVRCPFCRRKMDVAYELHDYRQRQIYLKAYCNSCGYRVNEVYECSPKMLSNERPRNVPARAELWVYDTLPTLLGAKARYLRLPFVAGMRWIEGPAAPSIKLPGTIGSWRDFEDPEHVDYYLFETNDDLFNLDAIPLMLKDDSVIALDKIPELNSQTFVGIAVPNLLFMTSWAILFKSDSLKTNLMVYWRDWIQHQLDDDRKEKLKRFYRERVRPDVVTELERRFTSWFFDRDWCVRTELKVKAWRDRHRHELGDFFVFAKDARQAAQIVADSLSADLDFVDEWEIIEM